MNDTPKLDEKPRAADHIRAPWEEQERVLMSTEEWCALPEERRRTIVLLYEKLRRRKNVP